MKQKPKQRKRKHTTATQPARYKNNDINEQYHVKHRVGKKGVNVANAKWYVRAFTELQTRR